MREYIEFYKSRINGTPKQQADAHTLAELARYRNNQCRRKLAGTFISSVEKTSPEGKALDFGQMINQEVSRRQDSPGRRK